MDPTLAALLGAGVGALVTALSPWLTGRAQHKLRRREVMREAYLDGMRCAAALAETRMLDMQEMRDAPHRVFEASLVIELSGTTRTSDLFQAIVPIVSDWSRACLKEMELRESDPQAQAALAAMAAAREAEGYEERANSAYDAFVRSARRDMAVERPLSSRLWRGGSRR